jgi:dipeptidyl aminopeptidase/acylaminoacyl peptidase
MNVWLFAVILSRLIPQSSPQGQQAPALAGQAPQLPPGAARLVNFDRRDGLVALCAETTDPPVTRGARKIRPTQVWFDDGRSVRVVTAAAGACDPVWSPSGERLAFVALDGLWVVARGSDKGQRLVPSSRPEDVPPSEFKDLTFSKPQWSPDGSRVAYLVGNGGTSWVEVVDAETGTAVYKSPPENYEFSWGQNARSLRIGGRLVRIP